MEVEHLDPLTEFIENLGLSVEADGTPRIAGRILGLLIVEEGPFCFDELAERLQVSRGSISTNTRLLEERGLIERFTVPGQRRDLFRLGNDLEGRLLQKSLERMQRTQEIVDRCLERLPASCQPALSRLATMSRFYSMAIDNTVEMIERWRVSEDSQRPHASTPSSSSRVSSTGVSS